MKGKTIIEYDFRVDPSHETFVWLVWEIPYGGSWCLRGCASTESIAKRMSKTTREVHKVHSDFPRNRMHIEKVLVDHLFGASMMVVHYAPEIVKMLEAGRLQSEAVDKEKEETLERWKKLAEKQGIKL